MLLASRLVRSGEIAVATKLNEVSVCVCVCVCVCSTSFCEENTSSSERKGETACWRLKDPRRENV